PDFYEQVIASDPSVFEVVQQFIDRLIEQQNYREALKVVRQYQSHFPAHQAYFLEKEVSVLVSLRKEKEAESVYVKAFDPWWPEELATIGRLLVADGEAELASRFLYTLYAQGGLQPGSELRATVLYHLFKLLEDAKDERTALTAGDLRLYQEVATSDPHPGLL